MSNSNESEASTASFEVEIEKLVYGGDGLGRHQGQVVFVPFSVPGDRVEVLPIERKKGFIRAVITRIVAPGPARRDPSCPHFGQCGGCQWQHLDYTSQVETKRKILEEVMHHRFPETRKLAIAMKACPNPYGYRTRARVQLRGTGAQSAVGFFRHRSAAVEDVEACPLFRPPLNEALASVRKDWHEGHLGSGDKELELACAGDQRWACSASDPAPVPENEPPQVALLRNVGEFDYATTAEAFFQANDFMLDDLIAAVMDQAPAGDSALDLFSGVGFFSLPLARRYRSVVAVESAPGAHHLGVRNAAHAGLQNIQAVCGEVRLWMDRIGSIAPPAFDLILLDPPRTGAGPEVLKRIAEWAPVCIIYVSCDPQTLVRDLAALPARDYRIDSVTGLDIFPQTFHFESVVRLSRR